MSIRTDDILKGIHGLGGDKSDHPHKHYDYFSFTSYVEHLKYQCCQNKLLKNVMSEFSDTVD